MKLACEVALYHLHFFKLGVGTTLIVISPKLVEAISTALAFV